MASIINRREGDDVARLFVLMRQTVDATHRLREIELRSFEITPEQAAALICIKSIGKEATPAEIARWLFRERNSTSVLLARMEKQGLIKKTADLKKKNLIRVTLTAKGKEALHHALKFRFMRNITDSLSPRKLEQLRALLHEVRDKAMEQLGLDTALYSRLFDRMVGKSDKDDE